MKLIEEEEKTFLGFLEKARHLQARGPSANDAILKKKIHIIVTYVRKNESVSIAVSTSCSSNGRSQTGSSATK